MANPFTRFLSQWSADGRFQQFIAYWDALELVVVQVYRQRMSVAEAQPEYARVWPWLRQHYGTWADELRPFWQITKAAGAPTAIDPFQLLLDISHPQAILDNWPAMQHLPAAREALNQYILSHSQQNNAKSN